MPKKQKRTKYTNAELDAQVRAVKQEGGHITRTQLKLFYMAGGFESESRGKNRMVTKRKAPAKLKATTKKYQRRAAVKRKIKATEAPGRKRLKEGKKEIKKLKKQVRRAKAPKENQPFSEQNIEDMLREI